MNPLVAVLVFVNLFFVTGALAGPACARHHFNDPSCVELCGSKWGFPGAVMGMDPWGPVMKPLAGPAGGDMSTILSQACGSPVPDSEHWPTSSLPAQPSVSDTAESLSFPSASPVISSTSASHTSASAQSTTSTTSTLSQQETSSPTVAPTSTAPAPPSQPSSTQPPQNNPPTSGGDIGAYLSAHNSVRAQHGAAPLSWSDQLAGKAQEWADKCVFQHSGGSLGPYGENLAAGTGSNYGIAEAIKSWSDEASTYNSRNPQPSHFTQMVWKATNQVGCAVASCNGIFPARFGIAKFFVCEYFPQGNVIGEFAQNVQA